MNPSLKTFSQKCVLLGIILSSCLILDQSTKVYADVYLRQQPPQTYLYDTFRIQYARNPGGFLSLGSSLEPQTRFIILTVLNGVVLFGAFLSLFLYKKFSKPMWYAIAWIVAGGFGNLIDRIRLSGEVIDFLNMGIGSLRTGIFNVADVAITGGEVAVFYLLWKNQSVIPDPEAVSAPTEQSPTEQTPSKEDAPAEKAEDATESKVAKKEEPTASPNP